MPTAPAIDGAHDTVEAALTLARAFAAGRRLAIHAPHCADHGHHVAVEFVHPVVTGARALPAAVFAQRAAVPAGDVVLAIDTPAARGADVTIDASLPDTDIVRAYHVLWELVQVCLDHPGIAGADPGAGGDSTGFLYPFLDGAETDEAGLRADLGRSAETKRAESAALCASTLDDNAATIIDVAARIGDAVACGGRVVAIGNGGSSTDAARMARLLGAIGVPALSLAEDYAIVTALANDIGPDQIFTRQLDAVARPGDVLFAWSTSGASRNLVTAWERAARSGVACFGSCGYGGGAMDGVDELLGILRVESTSVHRIQEAQAALMTALVERIASDR